MNVLSEIIAKKRERVAAAKGVVPLEEMRRLAFESRRNTNPHALLPQAAPIHVSQGSGIGRGICAETFRQA